MCHDRLYWSKGIRETQLVFFILYEAVKTIFYFNIYNQLNLFDFLYTFRPSVLSKDA